MDKTTKLKHVREYIKDNPSVSATGVYNHFKGSKYGTRKQDVLKLYRTVKAIPKKEDTKKYIPKKYRKPKTPYYKEHPDDKYDPRQKDESEIPEQEYIPFYHALEVMVKAKHKYPKNFADLRDMMYRRNFNGKKYPSPKQSEKAWEYLKKRSLLQKKGFI